MASQILPADRNFVDSYSIKKLIELKTYKHKQFITLKNNFTLFF